MDKHYIEKATPEELKIISARCGALASGLGYEGHSLQKIKQKEKRNNNSKKALVTDGLFS